MKKNLTILVVGTIFMFLLAACCKHHDDDTNNTNNSNFFGGWNGGDDPSKVPTSLNFGFASPTLSARVDLTPYLPPIGDQSTTGTCVAWACGYYTKTASEAIVRNLSQSALGAPSNQMSPKYLFYAIPDNLKGAGCDGTDFTYALDVLQQKGIATMATVPFSNLGNCNSSLLQPGWNTEATQHKIKYYRKIDFTLTSVKQQLANKYPVIIGIDVRTGFNNFRGSQVMMSNSGTFLGRHALAVVGYDDSKGPNGAFRIANSWGTLWGDGGFVWVDYNLFFNSFVYNGNAYIIASDEGNVTPPSPNPTPTNNGVDLATWVFSDVSTAQITGHNNSRSISFNVYNIGSQSANTSSNWSFYYLYYNAYNANDYGVLFQDAFNTSVTANTYYCPTGFACNFNFSIPAGSSFAQRVFNQTAVNRGYSVPALNGYYYLVLVADPGGVFTEQNEQNNIFYTTSQFPKFFSYGYSNRAESLRDTFSFKNELSVTTSILKKSNYNSAVNQNNRNAYTPEEILGFLKQKIKNGELKNKLQLQMNALPGTTPDVYPQK
jgi:hypothetical protein